jgi:hypothetical protein
MNTGENSHELLVEKALVGFDLAAEHHLAHCAPCQEERERVGEALREFGNASREQTGRPEMFWEQQAARIRAASSQRAQRSRLGLTLAPGLAVLFLVAFALLSREPSARPTPATAMAQVDSDHELLVEVERVVETDTPLSLEPATFMIDQDDSSGSTSSTNSVKEPRSHEN